MSTEYEINSDLSKVTIPEGYKIDQDTLDGYNEILKGEKGCISLGPLKLCYELDLPKITITLSVLGVTIAKVVLDPRRPCQRISINVGLARGYVELCIKGSCLILNGEICILGSCTRWNNRQIVCW